MTLERPGATRATVLYTSSMRCERPAMFSRPSVMRASCSGSIASVWRFFSTARLSTVPITSSVGGLGR